VSDYPADMRGQNVWTFRTVVWWGHFISFSLILCGKYKKALSPALAQFKQSETFFTLAGSPWKLEFSPDIQKESMRLTLEEMTQHFEAHDFIKWSRQEKLENINQLPTLPVECFEQLIEGLIKLA